MNKSSGLIEAVPELNNISFSVGFEHCKTIPINVTVDSVEYLKKMKRAGPNYSNSELMVKSGKSSSTVDSSEHISNNQSSIIDAVAYFSDFSDPDIIYKTETLLTYTKMKIVKRLRFLD